MLLLLAVGLLCRLLASSTLPLLRADDADLSWRMPLFFVVDEAAAKEASASRTSREETSGLSFSSCLLACAVLPERRLAGCLAYCRVALAAASDDADDDDVGGRVTLLVACILTVVALTEGGGQVVLPRSGVSLLLLAILVPNVADACAASLSSVSASL